MDDNEKTWEGQGSRERKTEHDAAYLDPRQVTRYLHIFHLLLCLGVQVKGELGRLLVVCPAVVVLQWAS
jgi:hypothetical protein